MFESTDRIVHAANLLVCIGGLATATGVITGGGAVIGGYLSWREVMKRLPAGAAPLAKTVQDRLRNKIDAETAAMNGDTAVLIPQMIEAARPDPKLVVEAGLQANALLDLMVGTLTFHDHKLPEHVTVFRRILKPILTDLLADPGFTQQLAPEIHRAVLAFLGEMSESLTHLSEQYGSLSKSLDDLRNLRLRDLQFLALKFGLEAGDSATADTLVGELQKKAEDVRAYQAEIDAIDERTKGLGNLKGAARDAADRLDFDAVEALLARVQEIELEIAAETAELRARNALIRGRVDQAYDLLSAAADSFAGVDPLEPARRRILTYSSILRNHGERYGRNGLHRAEAQLRPVLTDTLKATDDQLWAAGQNALAITLRCQASRTDCPRSAALFRQAVKAIGLALSVYTRDTHPVEWAMTQNILGNVLYGQGSRIGGTEGAALLRQAVEAYRDALIVRTRDAHPEQWAVTQNNLANALSDLGEHSGGAEAADLLAQVVEAYRAALSVYTRDAHPAEWAGMQNNLATALKDQGHNTDGTKGATLLAQAVEAYHSSLSVYTRDAHPVGWAKTQENMAIAEEAIAAHESCADPWMHLEAALGYVEAALEEFDPDHMPFNHNKATALRHRIREALDRLGGAD